VTAIAAKATQALIKLLLPLLSRGTLITLGFLVGLLLSKGQID
jgi:hypothetical protein